MCVTFILTLKPKCDERNRAMASLHPIGRKWPDALGKMGSVEQALGPNIGSNLLSALLSPWLDWR
jgi:hypothetical protein